jgi:cold shock protein
MTDHDRTNMLDGAGALPVNATSNPDNRELGSGTGKDFIARVNRTRAQAQVRKMLQSADQPASDADVALAEYGQLTQWEIEHQDEHIEPGFIPAGEVFECAGLIRWFDPSKGYGFITPDDRSEDVLLSTGTLRAAGFETASEGARVHCQAVRRTHGLQAIHILNIGDGRSVLASHVPRIASVEAHIDWERGMVKWFNRLRGFGFISQGETRPDVFVHMDTLRRCGYTELRPGQIVDMRWGESDGRRVAVALRPPS